MPYLFQLPAHLFDNDAGVAFDRGPDDRPLALTGNGLPTSSVWETLATSSSGRNLPVPLNRWQVPDGTQARPNVRLVSDTRFQIWSRSLILRRIVP